MSEKVEKLVEVLKGFGENEFKEIGNVELENGYVPEVGYAYKNGRGSYQLRIRYGITTILKIRNSEEFKQIKEFIKFLEKNKHVLEALDKLNERPTRRTVSTDAIEL